MRKLFTQNAISEELGLHRRVVAMTLGGVEPDGKVGKRPGYFMATYFRAAAANRKPAGAVNGNGVMDDASHGSYANERARLTAEKAAIAEMRRKELAGELVSADEVARTWTAIARVIRTELLAIPAKTAARLGMARNAIEAQAILKETIDEVLAELADTEVEAVPEAEPVA